MSDEQQLRDRIDELEQKLKHMDEIDVVDKEQTWVEILIVVWLVVLSGLVFFKERGGDPHQQAIQQLQNRTLNVENRLGELEKWQELQRKVNASNAMERIKLEQQSSR